MEGDWAQGRGEGGLWRGQTRQRASGVGLAYSWSRSSLFRRGRVTEKKALERVIPMGEKLNGVAFRNFRDGQPFLDDLSAAAGMNAKAGSGARGEDLRRHAANRKAWPAEQALQRVIMSDIGGGMSALDGPRDADQMSAEVGGEKTKGGARRSSFDWWHPCPRKRCSSYRSCCGCLICQKPRKFKCQTIGAVLYVLVKSTTKYNGSKCTCVFVGTNQTCSKGPRKRGQSDRQTAPTAIRKCRSVGQRRRSRTAVYYIRR